MVSLAACGRLVSCVRIQRCQAREETVVGRWVCVRGFGGEVNVVGDRATDRAGGTGPSASSSKTTATLTNARGSSFDQLGFAVALSRAGTTVLVGAPVVSNSTGAA